MSRATRVLLLVSLLMLLTTLAFGLVAAVAFVSPTIGRFLHFEQLRAIHVSAALFWIIGGGVGVTYVFAVRVLPFPPQPRVWRGFVVLWMVAVSLAFVAYALRQYGGREYWEFPPSIGAVFLAAFAILAAAFWKPRWAFSGEAPAYLLMWTTGIGFLLTAFVEQNLYLLPWFGGSVLREIAVQWKSNGSMVGAWNQLIYGSSLYLMVQLSGDRSIAVGRRVYLFWLLGFTNLLFNWGHHFYSLPTADWIRHVAYAVSMTEWLVFLDVVREFRRRIVPAQRSARPLVHRFLLGAEWWVAVNLFLALIISIPAVNRFTHGTHVTVAHAMGTTIGINSTILLAILGYLCAVDGGTAVRERVLKAGQSTAMVGLGVMFAALLCAGYGKALASPPVGPGDPQVVMRVVLGPMRVVFVGGALLLVGLMPVILIYAKSLLLAPSPLWKRTAHSEARSID